MKGARIRIGRLLSGKWSLTDKEYWEYAWQKKNWVRMFENPEVRQKGLEYWQTHRFLDQILEYANLSAGSSVLDVGCGISTVLHYLPGERVGIDPIADQYREIYSYPQELRILRGYAEAIPFEDGRFDLVTCSNCIDHTDSPAKAIDEILRVLKTNGWFVLTCEVFPGDIGRRNAGHPHSITEQELLALVGGFQLVQHWFSPWYGLRRFALDMPPTQQIEHILLLRKPDSAATPGASRTAS